MFVQHKQGALELERLRGEGEALQQRNHQLSSLLKASQGELSDLSAEMELLRGKLKEAESSAG